MEKGARYGAPFSFLLRAPQHPCAITGTFDRKLRIVERGDTPSNTRSIRGPEANR
jgi:hypothetical protein